MCGKFTAKKGWVHVTDLKELAERVEREGDDPLARSADDSLTWRVMNALPVIVFDPGTGKRITVAMRWGFPDPKDWRRPQPIHARAETIESTRAFAEAFRDGQRGIVLMRNFNEAPDIEGPVRQHVIAPADNEILAAAFLWRSFDVGAGAPLFACVLVTMAANRLIAALPTGRMPAFLAPEDWGIWLGEDEASVDDVKACLTTREGARWRMTPEQRREKARRKPTMSDPGGLF